VKILSLAALALFAALPLTFFSSPAQIGPATFAQAGPPLLWTPLSTGPTNMLFVVRTNARSLFDEVRKANQRRVEPQRYAPGVYEARPYSLIVVVPGPHPDDRCLCAPGGEFRMRTRKPDLELIPRTPGKQAP
jgi:hypothetical protein